MTLEEPLIHKIYRRARPIIHQMGLSTVLRRLLSSALRETIAKSLGLEGFTQSIPATQGNSIGHKPRKFAFVFICQHGEIEVEAALLAISLKRFLRCEYELIAVVPTPAEIWGEPKTITLDLLRSLGVRIEPIINPIDRTFPNGNKLPCFKLQTDADKIFYLDSDVLLIREFYDAPLFDAQLNAKPTDIWRSVDIRGEWPEIYDATGVQLPTRLQPTTASKSFGFPQFNGGVICVDPKINLADTWEHYIRLIRSDERFTPDRIWSDQIGLALAIQHLGVKVGQLDERYNFPLHHKRLQSGISPYLIHYHYPVLLSHEPSLYALLRTFVSQYPQLTEIIEGKSEWESLLEKIPGQPTAIKKFSRQHRSSVFSELIITEIPQSGASDLCHVLQSYTNCFIVDEPEDVQKHLSSDSAVPWGVGLYYRETRGKITSGKPIRNGQHGEIVSDVDNQHFVLGTKNPVGVLPHLQRLRRVMPDAKVVICVRDPFATIASWKRNAGLYLNADLPFSALGGLNDPWLTEKHKMMLRLIASESDLSQKRAMLWHYFAELVLNSAPNTSIVNYEALAANPEAVTASILKGYDKGKLRPLAYSPETAHYAELSSEDRHAILAICSQSAAELGINMQVHY